MFLAQIRVAATEKSESRAGILRLIGVRRIYLSIYLFSISLPLLCLSTGWFFGIILRKGESLKPSGAWVEKEEVNAARDVKEASGGMKTHGNVEDPYERYRKMLKVGVPQQTVEEQMRIDGVNPMGMAEGEESGALKVKDMVVAKTKRRRWHWTQVAEAKRVPPPLKGSIWTQVNEKEVDARLTASSQAYLRALFVREISSHRVDSGREIQLTSKSQSVSQPQQMEKVHVFQGNKAVNLEFVVQRIRMPFLQVAKDLNLLTAMYLQETDIKTILAMWPSRSEEIALEEYVDNVEALERSEQFVATLRRVPLAKQKLECLLLKLELPARAENLKQAAGVVTRALHQLCSSPKWTKVLQLLRDFGNFTNEEFVENYKTRFSLKSLLYLSNTKSFDNQTTMLDGFFHILRMEDNGKLVDFYDEINLIWQCKSVSVDGLLFEMNKLREGHGLVKSVAVSSRDGVSDDAKLAFKAFTQFAEEVDDKLHGVQMSLDKMKMSKHKFESWFEEDASVPLDHHLKAIVYLALEAKTRNVRNCQKVVNVPLSTR